ncbi:hypothetical protein GOC05_13625 [Sinorhizobium meliloti]|nr:hypothetical protein [Sinorhizobium meliloti]
MSRINPPSDLSPAERRSFRNLVQALVERGIDPGTRTHLIADFVLSETRLADLRRHEIKTDPGPKLAIIRAVTTAMAERRRLYAALFKGARAPAPVPAKEKLEVSSSAIEAWQRYVLQYGWGKVEPAYSRLAAEHGGMPWEVLLDPKLAYAVKSGKKHEHSNIAVK